METLDRIESIREGLDVDNLGYSDDGTAFDLDDDENWDALVTDYGVPQAKVNNARKRLIKKADAEQKRAQNQAPVQPMDTSDWYIDDKKRGGNNSIFSVMEYIDDHVKQWRAMQTANGVDRKDQNRMLREIKKEVKEWNYEVLFKYDFTDEIFFNDRLSRNEIYFMAD